MIKQLKVIELERIDISDMTMLELFEKLQNVLQRDFDFKVIKGRVYLVSKLVIYREG